MRPSNGMDSEATHEDQQATENTISPPPTPSPTTSDNTGSGSDLSGPAAAVRQRVRAAPYRFDPEHFPKSAKGLERDLGQHHHRIPTESTTAGSTPTALPQDLPNLPPGRTTPSVARVVPAERTRSSVHPSTSNQGQGIRPEPVPPVLRSWQLHQPVPAELPLESPVIGGQQYQPCSVPMDNGSNHHHHLDDSCRGYHGMANYQTTYGLQSTNQYVPTNMFGYQAPSQGVMWNAQTTTGGPYGNRGPNGVPYTMWSNETGFGNFGHVAGGTIHQSEHIDPSYGTGSTPSTGVHPPVRRFCQYQTTENPELLPTVLSGANGVVQPEGRPLSYTSTTTVASTSDTLQDFPGGDTKSNPTRRPSLDLCCYENISESDDDGIPDDRHSGNRDPREGTHEPTNGNLNTLPPYGQLRDSITQCVTRVLQARRDATKGRGRAGQKRLKSGDHHLTRTRTKRSRTVSASTRRTRVSATKKSNVSGGLGKTKAESDSETESESIKTITGAINVLELRKARKASRKASKVEDTDAQDASGQQERDAEQGVPKPIAKRLLIESLAREPTPRPPDEPNQEEEKEAGKTEEARSDETAGSSNSVTTNVPTSSSNTTAMPRAYEGRITPASPFAARFCKVQLGRPVDEEGPRTELGGNQENGTREKRNTAKTREDGTPTPIESESAHQDQYEPLMALQNLSELTSHSIFSSLKGETLPLPLYRKSSEESKRALKNTPSFFKRSTTGKVSPTCPAPPIAVVLDLLRQRMTPSGPRPTAIHIRFSVDTPKHQPVELVVPVDYPPLNVFLHALQTQEDTDRGDESIPVSCVLTNPNGGGYQIHMVPMDRESVLKRYEEDKKKFEPRPTNNSTVLRGILSRAPINATGALTTLTSSVTTRMTSSIVTTNDKPKIHFSGPSQFVPQSEMAKAKGEYAPVLPLYRPASLAKTNKKTIVTIIAPSRGTYQDPAIVTVDGVDKDHKTRILRVDEAPECMGRIVLEGEDGPHHQHLVKAVLGSVAPRVIRQLAARDPNSQEDMDITLMARIINTITLKNARRSQVRTQLGFPPLSENLPTVAIQCNDNPDWGQIIQKVFRTVQAHHRLQEEEVPPERVDLNAAFPQLSPVYDVITKNIYYGQGSEIEDESTRYRVMQKLREELNLRETKIWTEVQQLIDQGILELFLGNDHLYACQIILIKKKTSEIRGTLREALVTLGEEEEEREDSPHGQSSQPLDMSRPAKQPRIEGNTPTNQEQEQETMDATPSMDALRTNMLDDLRRTAMISEALDLPLPPRYVNPYRVGGLSREEAAHGPTTRGFGPDFSAIPSPAATAVADPQRPVHIQSTVTNSSYSLPQYSLEIAGLTGIYRENQLYQKTSISTAGKLISLHPVGAIGEQGSTMTMTVRHPPDVEKMMPYSTAIPRENEFHFRAKIPMSVVCKRTAKDSYNVNLTMTHTVKLTLLRLLCASILFGQPGADASQAMPDVQGRIRRSTIIGNQPIYDKLPQIHRNESFGRSPVMIGNVENRFIAYDCSKPTFIKDFSYSAPPKCQMPEGDHTNLKTAKPERMLIYQKISSKRYQGVRCHAAKTRQAFHCGSRHQSALDPVGSFYDRPYVISVDECLRMMSVKKFRDPKGKDHTVEPGLNNIEWFLKGKTYNTDNNGPWCQGEKWIHPITNDALSGMVVHERLELYIETETFNIDYDTGIVVADTHKHQLRCPETSLSCQFGRYTYSWKIDIDQECPLAYTKEIQGVRISNDKGDTIFMSTDGSSVRFILKDKHPYCNGIVIGTHNPILFLGKANERRLRRTRKIDPKDISIATYFKETDKFIYHQVLDIMEKEFKKVMLHSCEQQVKERKYTYWSEHKDPGLTTWIRGNATFATSTGEVIYQYKCIPLLVRAVEAQHCYESLPIRILEASAPKGWVNPYKSHQVFMEPLTHRILLSGVLTPCSKSFPPKYVTYDNKWMTVQPELAASPPPGDYNWYPIGDMKLFEGVDDFLEDVNAGIHDWEDILSTEKFLDHGIITREVVSHLTNQIIGEGSPQGKASYLRPHDIFPKEKPWLNHIFDDTIWYLDTFGRWFSIILGLVSIWRLIQTIIVWIHRLFVLRDIHGCGTHMLTMPFTWMFQSSKMYRAYKFQQSMQTPEKKDSMPKTSEEPSSPPLQGILKYPKLDIAQ